MKTLVLGYYGAKNLGDDMMLYAIIDWLRHQGREITVISEDPEDTRTRFKIDCVQNVPMLLQWGWVGSIVKGRWFSLLRVFLKCDELVVGGGDLVRDANGWRNFFYTIEKMLLARLLGKKTYMVSVGITAPTKNYSKRMLKMLLPKCTHIIVRDKRTRIFCEDLGVKNVTLAPDIATRIPGIMGGRLQKESHSRRRCIVTLRMSPNVYDQFDIGESHFTGFSAALDKLITDQDVDVLFVPFQDFAKNGDNVVHRMVYEKMLQNERASILDWDGNVENTFNLFATADLIIGMRLHALIVGVSVGIPCIAMPYDTKLTEFCELAGIDDYITPDVMSDKEKQYKMMESLLLEPPKYNYDQIANWDAISL